MHIRTKATVGGPDRPYGADMRRREQFDPERAAAARERLAQVLGHRIEGSAEVRDPVPMTPRRARTASAAEPRGPDPGGSDVGAQPFGAGLRPELNPVGEAGRGLIPAWGLDTSTDLDLDLDRTGAGGPEELKPLRRFTRWHLGIVVALVALGLLWGGWTLLRARPVAMATPVPNPTVVSGPPVAASSSLAAPTPKPTRIVVHVLGAVRTPGLVTLNEGARVQDALDAAGGLVRSADPGELNLAQPLADGEQVLIGKKGHGTGEVRSGAPSGSGGSAGTDAQASAGRAGPVIDLNRATPIQLESLPGIGPVTAAKIVAWREQHGRFSRPDELQEVDGIGPKTYAQIAPHVRV